MGAGRIEPGETDCGVTSVMPLGAGLRTADVEHPATSKLAVAKSAE